MGADSQSPSAFIRVRWILSNPPRDAGCPRSVVAPPPAARAHRRPALKSHNELGEHAPGTTPAIPSPRTGMRQHHHMERRQRMRAWGSLTLIPGLIAAVIVAACDRPQPGASPTDPPLFW